MKMSMDIDKALLKSVVHAYGCESKTEAVKMALREMDCKYASTNSSRTTWA